MAALVGSLITYGIGHITGAAVSEWQLMFLILGAITAGFGLVLVPILPDSPAKAIFLSEKERAIAVQRTLRNKTGVLDNCSFNLGQAIQALKDPQAWFLVLYTFCVNLWNGGLTTVSPEHLTRQMNNISVLTFAVHRNHHQGIRIWDIRNPRLPGSIRRRRDNLPRFHGAIRQPRSLTAHLRGLVAYLHDDLQHHCLVARCSSDMEARSVEQGREADGHLHQRWLCSQHPAVHESRVVQRRWLLEAEHCVRHGLCGVLFGQYRRASILQRLRGPVLPGEFGAFSSRLIHLADPLVCRQASPPRSPA